MIPKIIQQWCDENNWTEAFSKGGIYYAFPPGAVIPLPVPVQKKQNKKIILLVVGICFPLAFILWVLLFFVTIALKLVIPWFLLVIIGVTGILIFILWISKISLR